MIIITEYGFDTTIVDWFIKNYQGKYELKAYGCVPLKHYNNYVIIPSKYHRIDKLGSAGVIAYWMYDNVEQKKIIHIDSDVYIKDYSILDKINNDLNNYNIVSTVKGKKKVVNCFFGMSPAMWKGVTLHKLVANLFGSWGMDCTYEYYDKLANKYPYKNYNFDQDCIYFKHYAAVGRGVHNFQTWVESGKINIDIGVWYEKKSIIRALGWSKDTGEIIIHNNVILTDQIVNDIVKYLDLQNFDLKSHHTDMKKNF